MRWVDSLPNTDSDDLADAADWLARAVSDNGYDRGVELALAGAIIRNHRKGLGWESERVADFPDGWSDEKLIWSALAAVALVGKGSVVPGAHLRNAEAALRTIWRRGQS